MAPSVTSLVPSFDPSGNIVTFDSNPNLNPQPQFSPPFLSPTPPLPPPPHAVSVPNSAGNGYHPLQESLFRSLPASPSSCWSGRNVEQIMAYEQDSSWTGGRSPAEGDAFYYRLPVTVTPDGLMGRLLNENVGLGIDPWKQTLPPPHPNPPPVNSFSQFDPRLSGFINPAQLMGYSGKLISDADRRSSSIIGVANMIPSLDASNAMINLQKNYLAEGIGVDRLRSVEDAQIGDENSVVIPANSAVPYCDSRKPGDAAETEEAVTVNSQEEEGSCYQREAVSVDANSGKKRKCGSRDFTKPNKEFKTDAETTEKCKRTKSYQEAAADDKSGLKEELPASKALNPASEPRKQIQASNSGTSGESDSKPTASDQPPTKPDYIHVRARRGQATDSHSLAERVRREKISERMKLLQDLVPGCNKVTGKAMMLDEIINYVQSLQRQVEFLSMKLAAVNPRLDYYNIENLLLNKEVLPNRTPVSAFGAEVLPPPPYPSLPSTCTTTTNTSQTSLLLQQQKKIVNNMPGGAELAATLNASIATATVSSATHPSIRSMMMMAPNSFNVADHNPSQVQQQVWGGDELHHVVQHMGGRGPFPLVSEPSSSSSVLVGSIAAALKTEM